MTVPLPRQADRAALRPQPARDGADFWPTPRCLSDALVRCVLLELPGPIWEPAAGNGCLLAAMRSAGRTVIASDLLSDAFGIARCDFLHDSPLPGTRHAVVVTNPPFNRLDALIARGLALLDADHASALVLLLRCDAMTADRRAAALNRAAAIWVCCWRPIWLPGTAGGGRRSNAWVAWRSDHAGPPVTYSVRRADLHGDDLFQLGGRLP